MPKTPRTLTPEQDMALTVFLDNIDSYTLSDLGPHLTCTETDVFADMLRSFGRNRSADALLEGHAAEDEEGDEHYQERPLDADACAATLGTGTTYQCGWPPAEGSSYCLTHAHLAG